MLQLQKFEFKLKYEGSSRESHIRVLCLFSVQVSTWLSCDTTWKGDPKHIQVKAENTLLAEADHAKI